MAYTDEQRQFYSKAKAAGWEPEKIKAGIERLGIRAAQKQQAPEAPPQQVMPDPNDPTRVDHGANPYQKRVDEMNPFMRGLMGAGGAVNNLVIGAQQMLPDSLKSDEYKADLQRQAEQQKQAMAPLEDTTAGAIGSIAGNVGAAVPAAMLASAAAPAGLGVAGMAGIGALEGGLMGAMAPTTKPGERAENAAWGAGLGGALPVAGKAVRSLVGEGNVPMQKAAEVLKRYGVSVPKSRQAGGAINAAADYGLENSPITSNVMESMASKKNDKVRSALFKMLGHDVPLTGEALSGIQKSIGSDIGAMTKGKTVPVADIADGVKGVMKDYKNLLPAQRNPQVMRYAAQLTNISESKGAKLKSEAYQAIRSDMAGEAAKAAPEHAKALRGMVKVLDDQFAKTLSPEQAAEMAIKKRQYRLAKVLDKANMVKEGEVDLGAARRAVESASRKGEVMPEARELLNAADIGIPKVKPKGILTSPGATTALASVLHLPQTAATLGGAGLAKALLNTGGPQWLVNSPLARKATAKALKAAMQYELSDED